MKHFLVLLTAVNVAGLNFTQIHELAKNNPGISICYTTVEPESLAGNYCIIYNKK